MAATVRAAKKPPAKKTTTPRATAAVASRPSAPFEPLRLSSTPDAPPEMVDLFEVDGEMYQVPREPPASISLKYLEAAEQFGEGAANLYVLREMLGADGYEALSNCKTLTEDHLKWVVTTLLGLVLGTVEAPKA